jgi:hypothetical protein
MHPAPKKCKDDQVLNPATNRCVKATGAIGKALLKKENPPNNPNNPNKCKADQVLNVKTNRCVSITGKIGQAILAQQKQETNIIVSVQQELKNKKGAIMEVNLTVVKSGAHTLEMIDHTGKAHKTYNTYVMHEIIKWYKAALYQLVTRGFVHTKLTGPPMKELIEIVTPLCKVDQEKEVKKHNSAKPCVNDSTLIMFEPLNDLPKDHIVQLKDGYCFDIAEIAEYVISTQTFVNPFTKNVFGEEDIDKIMKHKRLDKSLKLKLTSVKNAKANMLDKLKAMHTANRQLVENILTLIFLTGIQCTCDYSDMFFDSQSALGILFETLDTKLKDADAKNTILSMNSPGINTSLAFVAANYNTICIHQIGKDLTEIALFNIFELDCAHIVPEELMYNPPNTRMMIQVVDYYKEHLDYNLHVYYDQDPNRNVFTRYFARMGVLKFIQKKNRVDVSYIRDGIYGLTMTRDHTKYIKDNIMPHIQQVMQQTRQLIDAQKILKQIETVAGQIK